MLPYECLFEEDDEPRESLFAPIDPAPAPCGKMRWRDLGAGERAWTVALVPVAAVAWAVIAALVAIAWLVWAIRWKGALR